MPSCSILNRRVVDVPPSRRDRFLSNTEQAPSPFYMTSEQKSRESIDQRLAQAAWVVQDCASMNIGATCGVAVWEFPLTTGFVDYVLYAHAKVCASETPRSFIAFARGR